MNNLLSPLNSGCLNPFDCEIIWPCITSINNRFSSKSNLSLTCRLLKFPRLTMSHLIRTSCTLRVYRYPTASLQWNFVFPSQTVRILCFLSINMNLLSGQLHHFVQFVTQELVTSELSSHQCASTSNVQFLDDELNLSCVPN